MNVKLTRNCAIRERTADGISVGRCWFFTNYINGRLICPRHGDVTEVQKYFDLTKKLSEVKTSKDI